MGNHQIPISASDVGNSGQSIHLWKAKHSGSTPTLSKQQSDTEKIDFAEFLKQEKSKTYETKKDINVSRNSLSIGSRSSMDTPQKLERKPSAAKGMNRLLSLFRHYKDKDVMATSDTTLSMSQPVLLVPSPASFKIDSNVDVASVESPIKISIKSPSYSNSLKSLQEVLREPFQSTSEPILRETDESSRDSIYSLTSILKAAHIMDETLVKTTTTNVSIPNTTSALIQNITNAPIQNEKPILIRGLSRSLSREFESRLFETKKIEYIERQRSLTRPIIETTRIYSKKDQKGTVVSPTGKLEISQGKVNQYHLFETIGSGSYGRVVLARDDISDELFACKIISKSRLSKKFRFSLGGEEGAMKLIQREVAIMKKVSNHPNIMKLYEVLDDNTYDNLYLFLEYCERGPVMTITLGQPTVPFTEEVSLAYFRDVLLVHYNRIIHSDIKPENLLINSQGVVQISDFGISYMMDDCHNDDAAIQNCSPLFASPCVILGRKANGKCADIWALGVTLYCFVHGYCPFEDFSPVVLTEMILRDKPKYKKELSKSLVDLLESMLQKSSKSRITIAKMKVHLWVTDNGKKPMKTIEENCLTETITDEDMEKAFQPAKMSMSQVFYFNVDV